MIDCPHRPPCPGCPRFGDVGLAELHRSALEALARQTGAVLHEPVSGPPLHYRHRARLAVRGRRASPKIGIFQAGTHAIVDIPNCLVHHPAINTTAAAAKRAMRATGTEPYADRPHRGMVRYLQTVVERSSGAVQVVVVANAPDSRDVEPFLEALRVSLGTNLQGLFWNGNSERTNAILGPHWRHVAGAAALVERIGGADIHYPPAAFGQANGMLAERLAERVQGWTPDGSRVLEFHAGCGAIGLGLLRRAASVAMNETAPAALEGLALGIAARPPDERKLSAVLPGPASRHLAALCAADVVIVDPPRKGLEPELLEALIARPPGILLAVACGFEAFLREAGRLVSESTLDLVDIVPYLLFPQTDHVEIVARFVRRGTPNG